jgi:phosphate transport system protein
MSTLKEAAIQDIIKRFGDFADLILHQLSLIEKLISSGSLEIPEELLNELNSNEEKADLFEVKLSDRITNAIVLQQPLASDLRKLMACYRIIINLERIGDSVMNMINSLKRINNPKPYLRLNDVISKMLSISIEMVQKSILSFINNDREYALWTIKNDDVVDKMNYKLQDKIVAKSKLPVETEDLLFNIVHFYSLVSNIERIADHATNIAEASIYALEGRDIRHQHDES